jgi:hypothetical protein
MESTALFWMLALLKSASSPNVVLQGWTNSLWSEQWVVGSGAETPALAWNWPRALICSRNRPNGPFSRGSNDCHLDILPLSRRGGMLILSLGKAGQNEGSERDPRRATLSAVEAASGAIKEDEERTQTFIPAIPVAKTLFEPAKTWFLNPQKDVFEPAKNWINTSGDVIFEPDDCIEGWQVDDGKTKAAHSVWTGRRIISRSRRGIVLPGRVVLSHRNRKLRVSAGLLSIDGCRENKLDDGFPRASFISQYITRTKQKHNAIQALRDRNGITINVETICLQCRSISNFSRYS